MPKNVEKLSVNQCFWLSFLVIFVSCFHDEILLKLVTFDDGKGDNKVMFSIVETFNENFNEFQSILSKK